MDNSMTISMPLDEEGFMMMQCPRCGDFFKVTSKDYEADDVEELWCPICGLKGNSFWPTEIIELARAKALNRVIGDLEKEITNIGTSTSRQSLISLKITVRSEHKREGEVLPAVDAFEKSKCGFCGRVTKLKPLVKYVGAFCAFCGERL